MYFDIKTEMFGNILWVQPQSIKYIVRVYLCFFVSASETQTEKECW